MGWIADVREGNPPEWYEAAVRDRIVKAWPWSALQHDKRALPHLAADLTHAIAVEIRGCGEDGLDDFREAIAIPDLEARVEKLGELYLEVRNG